jgi:hypothetical protein
MKKILLFSILLIIPLISGFVELEVDSCMRGGNCNYFNLSVVNLYANNTVQFNVSYFNVTGDINMSGCVNFPDGSYLCGDDNYVQNINITGNITFNGFASCSGTSTECTSLYPFDDFACDNDPACYWSGFQCDPIVDGCDGIGETECGLHSCLWTDAPEHNIFNYFNNDCTGSYQIGTHPNGSSICSFNKTVPLEIVVSSKYAFSLKDELGNQKMQFNTINNEMVFFTHMRPYIDNSRELGLSGYRWYRGWFSHSITDGTYSMSVKDMNETYNERGSVINGSGLIWMM